LARVFHFEWCPKYRYKFRKEESKTCETILREIVERHGIGIAELSVMPDHVHIIVDTANDDRIEV